MHELPIVVQKADLRGLRIGKSRGFWILVIVALIAWWFWERDRKRRLTAPPILKDRKF